MNSTVAVAVVPPPPPPPPLPVVGVQAEVVQGLPCCACKPHLYREDLLAMEQWRNAKVSEAVHAKPVEEGGNDSHIVPVCSRHRASVDAAHRGHFLLVAQRVHANLRGNYQ